MVGKTLGFTIIRSLSEGFGGTLKKRKTQSLAGTSGWNYHKRATAKRDSEESPGTAFGKQTDSAGRLLFNRMNFDYAALRWDSGRLCSISQSTTTSMCMLRDPFTTTTSPGVSRQSSMACSILRSWNREMRLSDAPVDFAPATTCSAYCQAAYQKSLKTI